ncbi:NtaA/DmoA family FMN-dependent monooxygenase [Derxia gummosa]|uniref:NtaA/DmoA family FMN-dependent monooxygenase n=1 Tax=Derxia gummosa DSM 723 TaxID=1121388 RepID=A0A8B6XDE6_9BURK|nr:NtaA/DmoA family FMN-dependent monooxygenase [Derxia gummosa]
MPSMHLALYLTDAGIHLGGWRHPRAERVPPLDLGWYRRLAQAAEHACLDLLFIADKLGLDDIHGGDFTSTVETRAVGGHPEPITMLSALAGATERIGLAGTVSASYAQPYTVARQLASLDHLSGGRAAWNVVTSVSDGEARNHGRDRHYEHAERYRRAAEFIEVVHKLWDSWQSGWEVIDKAAGRHGDASRLRAIDHAGEFFRVKGPLNLPRPPQGRPVLVQAGVSGDFRRVAARHAEIVFTVAADEGKARAAYAEFKAEVAAAGRDPAAVRVLPGIVPIVGETERDARDLDRELRELVLPRAGLSFMSASMNHDLAAYDPQAKVFDFTDRITGSKGRFEPVVRRAAAEGLTFAELGKWYGESLSFLAPVGTAAQVAELMARWFRDGVADGFVVLPAFMPDGARDFLAGVVPELRARGAFREGYADAPTLRERLAARG